MPTGTIETTPDASDRGNLMQIIVIMVIEGQEDPGISNSRTLLLHHGCYKSIPKSLVSMNLFPMDRSTWP